MGSRPALVTLTGICLALLLATAFASVLAGAQETAPASPAASTTYTLTYVCGSY